MAISRSDITLFSPITIINGLGPKTANAFMKLGVFTLEDLFFLMPRRYEDRRNPKPLDSLIPGRTECTVARVNSISSGYGKSTAEISDSTGTANIIWFTDKIARFVKKGMRLAVYGQVSEKHIIPTFTHPEFEILSSSRKPSLIGKVFPVYPGTADLSQKTIKKFVDLAIDNYSEQCLKEFLPGKIIKRYGMMSLRDAVINIHRPDDELTFVKARNRLAFDEFFLLQTEKNIKA